MAQNIEHEATFMDKAEDFYQKYSKVIIGVVIVVVLVAAYFIYTAYQTDKRQEEAEPLMALPQRYFAVDSFRLALHGDGANPGFLAIMDDYSGTKAANLSHYYAGISYMQMGDFQNAVNHLEDFSTDSEIVQARAYYSLGHSYAQLGKSDKAASNYKKAANEIDDDFFTPYYLRNAGDYYVYLERWNDAESMYQRIEDDYPNSNEGQNIKKDLLFVQTKTN